ncbi:hypothetical protein H112_02335 [Trichophyton rubrum D6]|uniref:Uncharacterized protein n=3 Tax=Trichophyton TaxID=5550 RepID=A0A080WKM6_TRIRC|nr:uncharacterized protein TERG_12366 [Trichophyton rubrum CBS 118892]EZF25357.1 hypothetical protein H100_02336 [Trichophyton rubrum MR850]EZF44381.1 hypothetical protein H102_02333 [Trichophyton rubrum CBS 100081]EZF55040.1 hypothetical protein H103_02344 [Trichophyton rubrum CBS 288.86]EZF65652.1 hypothetical protein H104_02319 [Trichophyton rubrum CBS 289.86]EZF76295.1 hypothetical protein H105_02354 [Trichophyton soudanense CBS 452.61]EZF86913.1 hypothetical protein H110_02340 [Trichophy
MLACSIISNSPSSATLSPAIRNRTIRSKQTITISLFISLFSFSFFSLFLFMSIHNYDLPAWFVASKNPLAVLLLSWHRDWNWTTVVILIHDISFPRSMPPFSLPSNFSCSVLLRIWLHWLLCCLSFSFLFGLASMVQPVS